HECTVERVESGRSPTAADSPPVHSARLAASSPRPILLQTQHRNKSLPQPEKTGKDWSSFTKLPHLSGKSKPLHRRNTTANDDELLNRVVTSPPAGSLRELVLRSVYTHVDSDDNRILVTIARVMLTMQVTGPHLTAACKTDGGGVGPRGAGVREHELRVRRGRTSYADAARGKAERPRQISEEAINALYQVTGVLRSLANASEHLHTFVSSGALGELLHALRIHTDRDVLTNVARCLSVASGDTSCCSWLCACADSAGALLRALAACASRASLAVRLAYTLGNMAAGDQQARINIYNEEGSLDVLLTILESYTKRSTVAVESRDLGPDPDLHLVGSDLVGSDGSNEDVLIKTVRVIANLCLADSVGTGVAGSYGERTIRALLACLEVAEKSYYSEMSVTYDNEDDQYDRCDELAVAALATLNNVTFYLEPPPSPRRIDDTIDMLCKATCRWAQGSGLAACEAVRALGNLSRSARAAQVLVLEGALDLLPRFHTHEDASVRCSAAGLLVNVCGAGGGAAGGAAAATALAGSARRGDAPTAALLARALWNAHAHHPLDQQHSALATQSLALFIDDDSVFTPCEAIGGSQTSETKQHVKFGLAQDCEEPNSEEQKSDLEVMINGHRSDGEEEDVGYSTEDLEFEEGEGCVCASCKRLAGWEELVAVALPLLEALQPSRCNNTYNGKCYLSDKVIDCFLLYTYVTEAVMERRTLNVILAFALITNGLCLPSHLRRFKRQVNTLPVSQSTEKTPTTLTVNSDAISINNNGSPQSVPIDKSDEDLKFEDTEPVETSDDTGGSNLYSLLNNGLASSVDAPSVFWTLQLDILRAIVQFGTGIAAAASSMFFGAS
ncbi:unnamed protein product, partial [Leptidea sinapis]